MPASKHIPQALTRPPPDHGGAGLWTVEGGLHSSRSVSLWFSFRVETDTEK